MNDQGSSGKNDTSPPRAEAPHPVKNHEMPDSEPAFNGHQAAAHDGVPLAAYSEAPGNNANRAAQAGHAAAHHVEPAQHVQSKSKSKRYDEANLAKLVAEENASKSKFPRYPGLERWELLEKMGDGAFSNVYRARDLQGEHNEVGIKVVRKYEMNSMQVSYRRATLISVVPLISYSLVIMFCGTLSSWFFVFCHNTLPFDRPVTIFVCSPTVYASFYQPVGGSGPRIGKQTSSSGLQEDPKSCRGARNSL